MFTYGYLREAVMAHCDLEEDELQAMNVLKRLHIFANEAMQAICACKPKYKYFKFKVVEKYRPILEDIVENQIVYREASDEEMAHLERYNVADAIARKEYYESQNIYLMNEPIKVGADFISFTNKQSFVKKYENKFKPETFVNDWTVNIQEALSPVRYNKDLTFADNNIIICHVPGEYQVPYKAVWYRFTSAMSDNTDLDMPIDILNCLPLYIASVVLQIDYAQKAQIKRSEFEMALSRINVTDNMPVNRIIPSF